MASNQENQQAGNVGKVAAGLSLASVLTIGVWASAPIPYNDEIPKDNSVMQAMVVQKKIDLKNKYCLEKMPEDRTQCKKIFGEAAFRPVRENSFYAGPMGF